MANFDRPRGFEPHGTLGRARYYEAGAAVYPGDLVRLASDGQIDPVAAGETILGCALTYASAAGVKVLVADDPDQLYRVQGDETEFNAQTDVGNSCDVVATAGNSTYKTSRMEADSSTIGTSAAQLVILAIEDAPANAAGTNCNVIVKLNERQLDEDFAGV